MKDSEKRVYMLLRSVIFHYHGLDEEEKQDLEATANRLDAHEELKWALDYIAEDYVTSYPREKRVELINMVWEANNIKGYVTEMEATAMLKLAKDWNVEKELISLVLK